MSWNEHKYASPTEGLSDSDDPGSRGPRPRVLSLDQRVRQRLKQIQFGKNTLGYERYISLVPKNKRVKGDPRTPDIHKNCSKRSWDGLVRQWRRQLHRWDPPCAQLSESDDNNKDRKESQWDDYEPGIAVYHEKVVRGEPIISDESLETLVKYACE